MRRPEALKPGDWIGLTATARFLEEERLQLAERYFHQAGFRTLRSAHCHKAFHQFGGDDEQRAADFQSMIENQEIQAIFSVRGGYGTVRMLDLVDYTPLLSHPKWICGYSDITALHARLQSIGLCSLHATMPVNFSTNTADSLQATFNILQGAVADQTWKGLSNFDLPGHAQGDLVGGNLSVLYSLLGSADFPKLQGAILFIEEIDEYVYHIDRMLRALNRAGVFHGLQGVIVGGLTDMRDHDTPFGWSAEQLIQQCFGPYNIPVAFAFPAGHIAHHWPLILGARVHLSHRGDEWELHYE